MSDKSQKTEKPTARRQEKARKEGQFPTAKDFVSAVQFLAFVGMLAAWGGGWFFETKQTTRLLLNRAFGPDLNAGELVRLSQDVVTRSFLPLLLAGAMLIALTLATQFAITKMGFSLQKLAPDFKRMNPLAKLRELPRQNLPAFFQALFMLPLFGAAVYFIAKTKLASFLMLPLQGVEPGARQMTASVTELLFKAAGIFVVFGCINLFRQRRRYQQDLKMSKQEIREEGKEMEGNPHVKQRIRRLRRDLLRRQMMKEVPTASAVIVNPTHFAVAIRYRPDSMAAPTVVAKGKNYLALRIKKRAMEHQVPIIENPPLAQALYGSVEVGHEIPVDFYRAVAEILAYIHKLMHGRAPA